jgi:serine/threonine protein kinase
MTGAATAASGSGGSNVAIPAAWPSEVRERYEPVRTLGKGGFASVILAKDLKYDSKNKNKDCQFVAMKVVGGGAGVHGAAGGASTVANSAYAATTTYAHREIDILREISHPNIMTVVDYWETTTPSYSVTMALSYSKGPTLEGLLQYGGAFSTTFGRVVIAQVVDALAYLHYHAVVHRDIKPDNVIVTGAFKNQDIIWDNEEDSDGDEGGSNRKQQLDKKPDIVEQSKLDNDDGDDDRSLERFDTKEISSGTATVSEKEQQHWKTLRLKWKVTLVDFGFARALTPQDVASPSLDLKNENTKAAFSTRMLSNIDNSSNHGKKYITTKRSSGLNRSRHSNHSGGDDDFDASMSSSTRRRRSLFSRSKMDSSIGRSFSHRLQRRMSALGNRNFAAPEIVNGVQHDKKAVDGGGGTTNASNQTTTTSPDITQTVSEYVAEYGLMVDAYSLGHTIRYCMTGVPPYMGVEEALQEEHSLCRMLCGGGAGGKNSKTGQRSPHYRRVSECPPEVGRLITKLCEPNEKKRTSVRKVRRSYPWIYQTFLEQENEESPWASESSSNVEYLPCALGASKQEGKEDKK